MASVLEEISQEIQMNGGCCEIGADPELDDFMVTESFQRKISDNHNRF